MRRLFGIVLLCSSIALVAAGPSPAPSIAPLAIPKNAPTTGPIATAPPVGQQPTVIIYPFDSLSGLDPKVGAAISQILAQEITNAGGVTVLPVSTPVERKSFLDYARSQHADFYIGGYITPVGNYASVVEQVVNVDSGIILFSQTAQITTYGDVASQALYSRAQMLAYAGRGTHDIQTTNTETPAPTSTNGAQMQIKGIASIVDSVFGKHHTAATPTPGPVQKPPRGVIVAPVTASGSVAATDLTNASNELFFAMQRFYNAKLTSNTDPNVKKAADAICGSDRDNTVATGVLSQTQPKHGKPDNVFTLQVYTCFGALLDGETGKGSTIKAAVDAAVAAYQAAHADNS